jgi:transposase
MKNRRSAMGLYAGMDLHSQNTFVGIMEKVSMKRVYQKRIPNNLPQILYEMEPYRGELEGIVVESTYNWYWLVDGLMDAGYSCVHLANPSAIKQYEGLKHADDKHDAFWLAHMLSLGILPQGYIYPKEERPVRDLLRKRSYLVRQRTSNILSLQSMIERQSGQRVSSNKLKKITEEEIKALLGQEHLVLSAMANILTMRALDQQIRIIEKSVKSAIALRKEFECLLTVTGIGDILALTIMLEVGDIRRFEKVGNFSSYCRCVSSTRTSNGKNKGKGNSKNGNRYLAWAFIEAANIARRYNVRLNQFYQRKATKKNGIVATKALSNKLARACYYVMRDQVPFKEEMLTP